MAKILILSYYSGLVERGVETFAFELGRRLAPKHTVTILQAGNPKWPSNLKKPPNLIVRKIKSPVNRPKGKQDILGKMYMDFQSLKILLFSLLTLKTFFRTKFDVVIPLNGGWQTVVFRLVSKLKNTKVLISGHAGIGSDDAWNILFRPDVFVALTKAEESWAKRLSSEVRIEQIPNGVDLARFNPKIKAHNLSFTGPVVICASALDNHKRVDLTIKAVAKTKNLNLLVLGDGEAKGAIEALGKRLLGVRYQRLVVPYEKMASYYRAGKVFTLASTTEAFGLAYIEAMACNLPVVTTSDSSRQQIIGNAGILTNPENIDMYARDLSIAAKTNYRNIPYSQALNFSWNKVAERYSNLIQEISTK